LSHRWKELYRNERKQQQNNTKTVGDLSYRKKKRENNKNKKEKTNQFNKTSNHEYFREMSSDIYNVT